MAVTCRYSTLNNIALLFAILAIFQLLHVITAFNLLKSSFLYTKEFCMFTFVYLREDFVGR